MTTTTRTPAAPLTDNETLRAFAGDLAEHLDGWSLQPRDDTMWRDAPKLTHDEFGDIHVHVDHSGARAGEALHITWVYAAPAWEQTRTDACHESIGASASTGPQKVAAQITRRLLAGMREQIDTHQAIHEAAAAREARHDAAVSTIVAPFTQRVRTDYNGYTLVDFPGQTMYPDYGHTSGQLRLNVAPVYGAQGIDPSRHTVQMTLDALSVEQAAQVGALIASWGTP